MRVDLYGLTFETPSITCYLWSPWRASAIEHRLFEAIRALPHVEFEAAADELAPPSRKAKALNKRFSRSSGF